MKIRALINIALATLTVIYPVGVYFGLQYLEPRHLVLALLTLLLCRFLVAGNIASHPDGHSGSPGITPDWQQAILLGLMGVFGFIVFISNQLVGLLFYPVMVSLGLLAAFAYTLFFPPSMIERLARISNPDLPEHAIPYTRKVTIAWCAFFIFNGTIAAFTALFANMAWWTLYNGLISYLLMAGLFAIEYLVRQHVKRQAR